MGNWVRTCRELLVERVSCWGGGLRSISYITRVISSTSTRSVYYILVGVAEPSFFRQIKSYAKNCFEGAAGLSPNKIRGHSQCHRGHIRMHLETTFSKTSPASSSEACELQEQQKRMIIVIGCSSLQTLASSDDKCKTTGTLPRLRSEPRFERSDDLRLVCQ